MDCALTSGCRRALLTTAGTAHEHPHDRGLLHRMGRAGKRAQKTSYPGRQAIGSARHATEAAPQSLKGTALTHDMDKMGETFEDDLSKAPLESKHRPNRERLPESVEQEHGHGDNLFARLVVLQATAVRCSAMA